MIFTVPCRTFVRLSAAALQKQMSDREPYFPGIRGVRIENNGGWSVAVATNRDFLCGEKIGTTKEGNGAVNVSLDLVPAARMDIDGSMTITVDDASGWAVAVLSGGYFHPANAAVDGAFPDWRKLFNRDAVTKSNGVLALDAPYLQLLADCSPSGAITLPMAWDISKPIICRDYNDTDWFGLFLTLKHRAQDFPAAKIPEWI